MPASTDDVLKLGLALVTGLCINTPQKLFCRHQVKYVNSPGERVAQLASPQISPSNLPFHLCASCQTSLLKPVLLVA